MIDREILEEKYDRVKLPRELTEEERNIVIDNDLQNPSELSSYENTWYYCFEEDGSVTQYSPHEMDDVFSLTAE